jgi:pSer/pThr/pTyr-binding forkhead associated (FHA) protein
MFNCRDCPEEMRERCIQESDTSPSVKLMMRRAFEAGTDTQQMWGLLQMNCLLLREEQEARAPRQRPLMRRLKGEAEPVEATGETEEVAPPPSPPLPFRPEPVAVREPIGRPAPARLEKVEEEREDRALLRYCLVLQGGRHRIALPAHGEVVLGRFDPMINVTPDVDLSYDDREDRVISRRHACIVGHDGRHEIEDLGSTNGTSVNGQKLGIGQRVRLQSGDRVTLGHCMFVYVPLPEMQISLHAALPQAYLWVAFTGHRFFLPSQGEVVVGRSDPAVGFIPDIDLSKEGDATQVIARRHVKITTRGGHHYVEDLGSANGTKLNGARIKIGDRRLLRPGDHLWLGGCVLAYDVKLQSGEEGFD